MVWWVFSVNIFCAPGVFETETLEAINIWKGFLVAKTEPTDLSPRGLVGYPRNISDLLGFPVFFDDWREAQSCFMYCTFMFSNAGCINLISSLPLGWLHILHVGSMLEMDDWPTWTISQELPEQAQVKIMEACRLQQGLFWEESCYQFFTEELYPLQPNMGTVNKMMVCRYLFSSPGIFWFWCQFFLRLCDLGYWENLKSHPFSYCTCNGKGTLLKVLKWCHLSQFNSSVSVGCVATLKPGGGVLW